jgi:hypothetical protein
MGSSLFRLNFGLFSQIRPVLATHAADLQTDFSIGISMQFWPSDALLSRAGHCPHGGSDKKGFA